MLIEQLKKTMLAVWLHNALFIKMSVSHKRIYVISPNQFYVVSKCFMQVFYIDKFEVDICDVFSIYSIYCI